MKIKYNHIEKQYISRDNGFYSVILQGCGEWVLVLQKIINKSIFLINDPLEKNKFTFGMRFHSRNSRNTIAKNQPVLFSLLDISKDTYCLWWGDLKT